jgi:hypothetical protein
LFYFLLRERESARGREGGRETEREKEKMKEDVCVSEHMCTCTCIRSRARAKTKKWNMKNICIHVNMKYEKYLHTFKYYMQTHTMHESHTHMHGRMPASIDTHRYTHLAQQQNAEKSIPHTCKFLFWLIFSFKEVIKSLLFWIWK